VQKWTALIDLFSKDFIVVPVNQSLHWSLVIACHLGEAERLLDDSAVMDADADVIDVRSSAPPRAPCADAACSPNRSMPSQLLRRRGQLPSSCTSTRCLVGSLMCHNAACA
jgi:Ulp1 family protease